MTETPKLRTCAFCGIVSQLTDDHVPPRCLFSKPRPNDLITVPACQKCNGGTSKDDEYLRNVISMRRDVGDNDRAIANVPKIFRSLERPNAEGLRRKFVADIFPVEVRTPSGIVTGSTMGYYVDAERLHASIRKITRGLYWHETGHIVPEDFQIWVLTDETILQMDYDAQTQLQAKFIVPLAAVEATTIGDRQFHYRYQFAERDDRYSTWALSFFNAVSFLCMTLPIHAE